MKKLLFSLFALILPLAVSAEGWDDAREEIQELAKDMRRYN